MKDTFCSHCGAKYRFSPYPKTCNVCHISVWDNPTPVAVLLIEYNGGIYLTRRGIEPGKGQLALSGGYMLVNETWEMAAAREVMEEIQIRVDPEAVRLLTVLSSSNSRSLLIFGYAKVTAADILPFVKNEETEERVFITQPVELAFPTHTIVLANFFNEHSTNESKEKLAYSHEPCDECAGTRFPVELHEQHCSLHESGKTW